MQSLLPPRFVPAMVRSVIIDMPAWTRDISMARFSAKETHNTRTPLSLASAAFTSMPVNRVTDDLQDWFLHTTDGSGRTLMAAGVEPTAKGVGTYEPTPELVRPKAL